jgi:hypothetical protein
VWALAIWPTAILGLALLAGVGLNKFPLIIETERPASAVFPAEAQLYFASEHIIIDDVSIKPNRGIAHDCKFGIMNGNGGVRASRYAVRTLTFAKRGDHRVEIGSVLQSFRQFGIVHYLMANLLDDRWGFPKIFDDKTHRQIFCIIRQYIWRDFLRRAGIHLNAISVGHDKKIRPFRSDCCPGIGGGSFSSLPSDGIGFRHCARLSPKEISIQAQLSFARAVEQASRANESGGEEGNGPGKYHQPPVGRRLLLALLSLLGAFLLGLRGWQYFDDNRRALSTAWFCAGLLLALFGMGLWWATGFQATWSWPI